MLVYNNLKPVKAGRSHPEVYTNSFSNLTFSYCDQSAPHTSHYIRELLVRAFKVLPITQIN